MMSKLALDGIKQSRRLWTYELKPLHANRNTWQIQMTSLLPLRRVPNISYTEYILKCHNSYKILKKDVLRHARSDIKGLLTVRMMSRSDQKFNTCQDSNPAPPDRAGMSTLLHYWPLSLEWRMFPSNLTFSKLQCCILLCLLLPYSLYGFWIFFGYVE